MLQSILRILERMDQRFASVEADVATLKADMISVKADIATLKTDSTSVKADIATLKTDSTSVKADIEALMTVTDVLALKVATIEDTTADTNKRVRVRGFDG